MANDPTLKLRLVDVNDRLLGEQVDVMLRHQSTGSPMVVRAAATRQVVVTNVTAGVYQVQVDPGSYLAGGRFVMIPGSGQASLTMVFAIDPAKVKRAVFASFDELSDDGRRILTDTRDLLGFGGHSGADLYDRVDTIRKAGLLNILAKTGTTWFPNGRSVSSYVVRVNELRGDRFFAVVPKELREETKNSMQIGLFEPASQLLHRPPDGFTRAGSFKTRDHYGNLQLTFFSNGVDWVADVDIDDANGLAHVFQVLRNQLTNRPTHPFDIHQILIHHQKLAPGYRLEV
jgi:hypothetical protein